jgi:hypothetical protein
MANNIIIVIEAGAAKMVIVFIRNAIVKDDF